MFLAVPGCPGSRIVKRVFLFVVVSSFDGPKELWIVVRAKTNSMATQANVHLSNPDIVNNYFAGIATDDCYTKSEVLKFCRSHGTFRNIRA